MKCQNCNQNEADKTFVANWMGMQYQVHFCDDCLQQMWQYADAMGKKEAFKAMSGWWPEKAESRRLGDIAFPKSAGEGMKQRRKLTALRIQLEEAVQFEDYEEAARLRDSIAAMEQEVYSHES